ncbi:hypothetical protein CAP31_12285 [Sulfuriferula sp. AH1]|nr:hypothetical protein CAP31_12285 [Sulfuriferula sp. AH1]
MRKLQRSSELRQIVLHGTSRQYNLKRSTARTTLALTVNRQGLVVHAPWALPLFHIERFVLDKASWIAEKLARHVVPESVGPYWRDGMKLLYLGEEVALEVGAHIPAVSLKDRVLYAPQLADLGTVVPAWYQSVALGYFQARFAQFVPLLSRQPSRLKLSSARTRWGSCTREGVIRLNWRLIQASTAEIDYVLAHELAHLRHMNHSASFWQELMRIYPDYQTSHNLLRMHGHRYYRISS